jgi:Uma2 family endonuclease
MLKQYSFDTNDFELIAKLGIFRDQKVELLDGLIYDKKPREPEHENAIDELVNLFIQTFANRSRIRSQNSLNIGDPYSLLHPDVMILKRRNYGTKRPKAEDVFLLVEIANTSFATDTKLKLQKYAKAGIKDYWVANMSKRVWLVYRNPSRGKYRSIQTVSFDKPLAPLAFPEETHIWLE